MSLHTELPIHKAAYDLFDVVEKKQARRDQLLALAEKKKLPVLQGNEFGWGSHTDPDEEDGEQIYVNLDERCDDDADERTYREILGDAAPVNAVAEVGFGDRKDLKEFATPTALAKALKKAGWVPAETPPKEPDAEETAEQKALREKRDAEIEAERQEAAARRQAREAEEQRREDLKTKVVESLKTVASLADHVGILRQLVIGFIDMLFWENDLETTLMTEVFGYHPLEDEEDAEWLDIHHHAMAAIRALTLADLYAFAAAMLAQDDTNIRPDWESGTPAPFLDPIAEILGLATPTQAAQAQGDSAPTKAKGGKKTKAKAETAAATPPNEPAAPVENQLGKTAWPFPTGARP